MKQTMNEVFDSVMPERDLFWRDNKWYIIGGVLTLLLSGGFYGYHRYMTQRNAEAFAGLGNYIERYLKNDADAQAPRLDDGALALEAQAFSGTAAAPYFSAYEAQDLLRQGKIDEAAPILKNAVAAMPFASPLTALYKVKLALVQMEVHDKAVQDEGLALLKEVANDTTSPAWDVAVYYLGRYSWVNGDVNAAQDIWAPALERVAKSHEEGEVNRFSESPWLSRAEKLLKSIA